MHFNTVNLRTTGWVAFISIWSGYKTDDISPMKKLTELMAIDLSESQISDVEVLKELPNLKTVNLSNNPVSKAAVEDLKKALPHADVYY